MVDLAEIQAAYYMVAATGVLVAAAYYVLNMKATLDTRRLGLIDNMSNRFLDEEGNKRFFELMNYEWTDYADFDKKYGSSNNVESASKRFAVWTNFNEIGMMLRKGFVSVEDLYVLGMSGIPFHWAKYKPIIEETRRRYNGKEYLKDFEFLAAEMLRYIQSRDPSFRVSETLLDYDPNK
jgi:hypothetical protein